MVDSIRLALCQINGVVGDFAGNAKKIVEAYRIAEGQKADVALFPELALCGFPPHDLLLRDAFIDESHDALEHLIDQLDGRCTAVIGAPHRMAVPDSADSGTSGSTTLHNSAAIVENGRLIGVIDKDDRSNSGPLDEFRYFGAGSRSADDEMSFPFGGSEVIVVIGDDLSRTARLAAARERNPALILNLTGSAFHMGIQPEREGRAARVAVSLGCPVAVVNSVGGQDGMVFDGGSFVLGAEGDAVFRSERFTAAVDVVDVPTSAARAGASQGSGEGDRSTATQADVDPDVDSAVGPDVSPTDDSADLEELWSALTLGLYDYADKNGFSDVGLGLSGGVDSALVAALAADALGSEHVHGVLMPSRHSSEGSVTDAESLAANLGIKTRTIAIEPAHAAFEAMLADSFEGLANDVTEENLQARIRGTLLMALSNKFGWLILVTGNKSEVAVGYSTLYGDSAGGLAPLMDVSKQLVYALCHWSNQRSLANGSVASIPEAILTKAPSAELREGQRDDQSLPPYSILDPLLKGYVEGGLSKDQLVDAGFERSVVERITGLVDRGEYKRHQAPPGIIVTKRGFGPDWRMPLTHR